MPMDIRKIKKLIELLESSAVAEIEIKEGEDSVRISRHPQGGASVMMPSQPLWAAPAAYGFAPAAPVMPVPASPAPPAPAPVPDAEAIPGHVLRSPMVGTFYRASGPDSAPFIKVGDRIGPEKTVCIIEAMKVMNEIKAETSGVIARILTEDGKPVQYGQPLFELKA